MALQRLAGRVPGISALGFAVVVACAVALLAAGNAQAQANTHDGLFVQLDAGIGGLNSSGTVAGQDVDFSGVAGEFSAAAGAALTPNLVLAGQLWGASLSDPTVEVDGDEVDMDDTTLTLVGIGVDLTYYVMPINLYVSLSPSLTRLNLDVDGESGNSDWGFGGRLAVGKEWWISDNWGLGLNGQIAYARNKDEGETWTTFWYGIAFSATFN